MVAEKENAARFRADPVDPFVIEVAFIVTEPYPIATLEFADLTEDISIIRPPDRTGTDQSNLFDFNAVK